MSTNGRGLLSVIQCAETRRCVRRALDGGWEWVGYTKSGHVELRWPPTGALLHCATTPSDLNSWKWFANDIKRISGVQVWRKGNRRRSKKNPFAPDKQVEAARRKHAEQFARREAAAFAERQARRDEAARRRQSIADSVDDDRRRRDIEDLMRPGSQS